MDYFGLFFWNARGLQISNWKALFLPALIVVQIKVQVETPTFNFRWSKESPWETCGLVADFDWKKTAEPVMRLYTEATDGSYIEHKESALVWHHDEADPDFGSCQAKELLDHLESVLANEPVDVKRGQHIVKVNPQDLREKVKNKEKYLDVGRMVEGRGNSLDVSKPLELQSLANNQEIDGVDVSAWCIE